MQRAHTFGNWTAWVAIVSCVACTLPATYRLADSAASDSSGLIDGDVPPGDVPGDAVSPADATIDAIDAPVTDIVMTDVPTRDAADATTDSADTGVDAGPSCTGADCELVSISAGGSTTCAVRRDGVLFCWGSNAWGQLGEDPSVMMMRATPLASRHIRDALEVSVGRAHVCVIRGVNRNVDCWGSSANAQLGNGTSDGMPHPTPVRAGVLTMVLGVAAGAVHTCARTLTAVHCWGDNMFGQLGDGTRTTRTTPVEAMIVSNPGALAVGSHFTCATSTGFARLHCWGRNDVGQLGVGDRTDRSVPTMTTLNSGVNMVAAGERHAQARDTAGMGVGSVFGWGDNSNLRAALPAGTTASNSVVMSTVPVSVRYVAVGDATACAIDMGNVVRCWGVNDMGQAGVSPLSMAVSPTAVSVTLASSAVPAQLGLGSRHACLLANNGTMFCWGANDLGQRGAGSMTATAVPTEVTGFR